MYILKEINPIVSNFSGDPEILKPILFYNEDVYYSQVVKGYERKIRHVKTIHLINKKGDFLSGFLPRVKEHLKYEKVSFKFISNKMKDKIKIQEPKLKNIIFRDYQLEYVKRLINNQRGVYVEPTGGGKTIIIAGLMSCIVNTPTMVVVQTTSLFKQTIEELKKFFGKDKVGFIGGGKNELKQYNVGMAQSLKNIALDKFFFGMIIIDEGHHCNKLDGMYFKILDKFHAPYRFALTATAPNDKEQKEKLILEGLIGETVAEINYQDHIEAGILAKPIMKLKLAPENKKLKTRSGKYVDVYERGIVRFKGRNELIMQCALDEMLNERTVLILVERIMHGTELLKFANILLPKGSFVFLHGNTNQEVKNQISKAKKRWIRLKGDTLDLSSKKLSKKQIDKKIEKAKKKYEILSKDKQKKMLDGMRHTFEKKQIGVVIATKVWAEGINIKSVGCIINAVGGESEKAVIQRFGRGFRVTDEKDRVILYDIIDHSTHRYFVEHSNKRICYYIERGWLGN